MNQKEGYPAVLRKGGSDIVVCVPKDWTDDKVKAYAETENPCGTEFGWLMRTAKRPLPGAPYANQCEQFATHCHITLDA